ncbi:MAG: hypothetical protein WBY47_17105 [Desulfobacterales bacterium]|jgi:hypothetical protein
MFTLVITENESVNDSVACRSQEKPISDEYYSVQFFINGKGPGYLFKLRTISSNRPCILVKHDSSVFKELRVGDILDMEYIPPESFGVGTLLKTRITSKIPHDRYSGHSIVELSVIDN